MIRHNDGIVGNLLGDKFHPRVLECLTKHRVAKDRQRIRELTESFIHLQSLPTTPEPSVRIAGYGKSGNITRSVNRVCALCCLIQEVEVFNLLGSPL